MIKAAFSSLLIVLAASFAGSPSAGAKELDILLEAHCEARGLRPGKKEWVILAKGDLKTDPRTIADGDGHMPAVIEEASKHFGSAVYVPVGVKSRRFGDPGGTELQISLWRSINKYNKAFKTRSKSVFVNEIYGYQTLVVNGIPISAQLEMPPDKTSVARSRILLGYDRLDKPALVSAYSEDDLTLQRKSPLVLPEGEFLFVYSDCRTKFTTEKAK